VTTFSGAWVGIILGPLGIMTSSKFTKLKKFYLNGISSQEKKSSSMVQEQVAQNSPHGAGANGARRSKVRFFD
jgi:hypothetical protein